MPHIVKSYDQDLKNLRKMLHQQAQLTNDQLINAWKALTENDDALAENVRKGDKEINQLNQNIRLHSTELLALRQPMAYDLRLVVSSISISSNIERIGDVAKSFVKSRHSFDNYDKKMLERIGEILKLAINMYTDALECLKSKGAQDVLSVWRQDDQIDELYHQLFKEILDETHKSEKFDSVVKLLFVLKSIERIGDHASNIAEEIYYIFKGSTIFEDQVR